MAKIGMRPTVQVIVTIELTEEEARALDALAGYGDDAFIKVFYEHLGAAYMRDHEGGLRSLLKSARDLIPGVLSRADSARLAFEGRRL